MFKILNTGKIFWLFVAFLFIVLIVVGLVQKGMFLDGVTYSAISNNMANGMGTFFKPHYSQTWYNEFYMQPPLVFWLQSFLFKVIGEGFLVERIYSFLMAIFTIYGIVLNWRLVSNKLNFNQLSWIPVMLWVITPIIFWSYRNNMLENTLSVFSLWSVYYLLKGLLNNKVKYLFLGSIFILGCFLTKGLVGLFPFSVVFIYYISFRTISFTKTILYSFLVLLFPVMLYTLLIFLNKGFLNNLNAYIENQLVPSLNSEREVTTGNRFTIIFRLVMELSVPILICIAVYVRNRLKKQSCSSNHIKRSLFFIFIGLSASLPLMITFQQRAYYLVMSLCFYIIGISIYVAPNVSDLVQKISQRARSVMLVISIFLITGSLILVAFKYGDYSRDRKRLEDIDVLSLYLKNEDIISCSKTLYEDWALIAYMSRNAHLSLDENLRKYHLIKKSENLDNEMLKDYHLVDIDLQEYKLYQKKINTGIASESK